MVKGYARAMYLFTTVLHRCALVTSCVACVGRDLKTPNVLLDAAGNAKVLLGGSTRPCERTHEPSRAAAPIKAAGLGAVHLPTNPLTLLL